PPVPSTERLPTLRTAPEVVNGEARAINLETPESAPRPQTTMGPARFGDVSFPKLMKGATTRPLAAESEPTSAETD
ncbi:MAG TPA: hypothetical protein VH393_16860, partial [Ktedonobacterales bacterium]